MAERERANRALLRIAGALYSLACPDGRRVVRRLGAYIGFALSLLPAVAVANLAPDASWWLALPPIWVGCAGAGYLVGCAVDALQRTAEAYEQMARRDSEKAR